MLPWVPGSSPGGPTNFGGGTRPFPLGREMYTLGTDVYLGYGPQTNTSTQYIHFT